MPRIIEGTSMNITGEKIKYYRKMRKLSQQQLSDKLETLVVYICRGSIIVVQLSRQKFKHFIMNRYL